MNRKLLLSNGIKLLYLLCIVFHTSITFADDIPDWKSDWVLEDFFSISIDTSGYQFPTSIAFVPNPGNGPKDPLYFVTELRGKVKVVTNDRSVYTFAEDFFKITPLKELPSFEGELGLAGICLDPENGYVFVTFAYQDSDNILRNNIMRFEAEPRTFSIKPKSRIAFTDIFAGEESSSSHQIGPCQVYNNLLYVSVGDGRKTENSQIPDSTLGKVLRMTLDGKPVKSNPFYIDDDVKKPRNYVWAYGLRNPFGLRIVEGRVFVADNGMGVDRFLEIHEGDNYLWDGTDWSIGTSADVLFAPSVCPVQLDYYPENVDIFPDKFRGKFYLALAGEPESIGPGVRGDKSIIMLDFGFKQNKMLSVPKHFLKYRGNGLQIVTGLGIGPDGLYFTPLFPNAQGLSAVLKVQYDKGNSHPYKMSNETDGTLLLGKRGCLGCHTLYGQGLGKVDPNLNRDSLVKRLNKRLNSAEYIQSLTELDGLDIEPYESYKDARKAVLQGKGDERIRTWIKFHLIEPKFDNPSSQMPNLGITESEAIILTDLLMKKPSASEYYLSLFQYYIPQLKYRYLVYSFLAGGFLAILFIAALYLIFLRKR